MNDSYCTVRITVPGLGADNIYEIIKTALEKHNYCVKTIEKDCSTGPRGFLERHEECINLPYTLEEPQSIELEVAEQPWGG